MKSYLVALFLFGLSVSGFAHAQCAAFPCVVASVSLNDQSQAISSTPVFTPTADGVFRISLYLSTSAGTNKRAYWSTYVGWTDAHGTKQDPFTSALQNSASGANIVVQDVGGQPLLYQVK